MELKDFRRQYTQGGLQRASLPEQPLALFEQWQADAAAAGLADPYRLCCRDRSAKRDGASAFRVAEGRR